VPPQFSAIKIDGERAYDLARAGETVEIAAREIEIGRLEIVEMPDAGHTVFEVECGKGTYVRSLARDIGRLLGCYGHVSALRRTACGPFDERDMIPLEELEAVCHRAASGEGNLADALLPVETALDDIPALAVTRADAARLHRGQAVLLRGRDAPATSGTVYVTVGGRLLALAELGNGELIPKRVFNLNGLAHKVVFDAEFTYADASANYEELPMYDFIDDTSIIEMLRRLQSGALPPTITGEKFDPRNYLFRNGIQGWVTSPSAEIVDDLMALRMGMRHRLQTKRGPVGNQHPCTGFPGHQAHRCPQAGTASGHQHHTIRQLHSNSLVTHLWALNRF